jgi:hypothetical protein
MQITTTGYGDNVSASNLGRFVCVFVMLLGTILVSMMTAACTEFLELTPHQVLVTKYPLNSRRTKRIFLAMVPLLQFVFRVKKGWRKNDWTLRTQLRTTFWKAVYESRAETEEEGQLNRTKNPQAQTAGSDRHLPAHLPPSVVAVPKTHATSASVAQETQEEGKETGLADDMTDNIAHPHDLATEILSLKHVMTMEVMLLREDIAKCTLEIQQVNECVAQILIMTAEMQTVRQRSTGYGAAPPCCP